MEEVGVVLNQGRAFCPEVYEVCRGVYANKMSRRRIKKPFVRGDDDKLRVLTVDVEVRKQEVWDLEH